MKNWRWQHNKVLGGYGEPGGNLTIKYSKLYHNSKQINEVIKKLEGWLNGG